MNQERAKKVSEAISAAEGLQADIQTVRDEEQDAYDNLPASLQEAERGQRILECADALAEAYDAVQSCIDSLNNIEM